MTERHTIPPLYPERADPRCSNTRRVIADAAAWLWNIEVSPGIYDPGHDDFISDASKRVRKAIDAFHSRPDSCEMTMEGDDDIFDCTKCRFGRTTDNSH